MVRLVLSVLFLLISSTVIFDENERYVAFAHDLGRRGHELLYSRTVHFDGLEKLSADELAALLPVADSNISWLTGRERLRAAVRSHPLVSSAEVEPCAISAIDCFRISIRERKPAFIAKGNGQSWIVASDGSFLSPLDALSGDVLELHGKRYPAPIQVGGVLDDDSPEVVRARIDYVRDGLAVIAEETQLRVVGAQLSRSGELAVRFAEFGSEVVFERSDAGFETLRSGAAKLQRVLSELGRRVSGVDKIDLAVPRMAVVSLANARPVVAPQKKG